MTDQGRYEGRPMLRLLELYLQKIAGELTSVNEDRLSHMTLFLQQTFNMPGSSWEEIVSSQVIIDEEMRLQIVDNWLRFKAETGRQDVEEFSMLMADEIIRD